MLGTLGPEWSQWVSWHDRKFCDGFRSAPAAWGFQVICHHLDSFSLIAVISSPHCTLSNLLYKSGIVHEESPVFSRITIWNCVLTLVSTLLLVQVFWVDRESDIQVGKCTFEEQPEFSQHWRQKAEPFPCVCWREPCFQSRGGRQCARKTLLGLWRGTFAPSLLCSTNHSREDCVSIWVLHTSALKTPL